MLAGFHLLFFLKVCKVIRWPDIFSFLALDLILRINFSQGPQKGLYSGTVIMRIPNSFHKSLTMLAVCIRALSTYYSTTFELSSLKIYVTNFLNFFALNVWMVPTMPSALEEENANIKLILNFEKFTNLKALLPYLLHQYSMLDSDKNLKSSIYTRWKSLLSNVPHKAACVYICWRSSWPSATRLRSPHFLYIKPRLSRIPLYIVFCWTWTSVLSLNNNSLRTSGTVNFLSFIILRVSSKVFRCSLFSLFFLLRYFWLSLQILRCWELICFRIFWCKIWLK